MKRQDHPNIVKLYEIYYDKARYYAVMEYCAGGELFDQIVKKPYYSESDAAVVMKQLLSAVSYIHAMGITHRDIKPENLLLDSKEGNQIKLVDFGSSQVLTKGQMLKERVGTPYYMAPEILAGSYNEKCDIWSCGVILFLLLSGETPFDGATDADILSNVSKGLYLISGPIWS